MAEPAGGSRPAERGRSPVGAWVLVSVVAVIVLTLVALGLLSGLPLVVAIVAVAAGYVAVFVFRPGPRAEPDPRGAGPHPARDTKPDRPS